MPILAAVLLANAALTSQSAVPAPAAPPEPSGTIVVTGQRLPDYRARVAECLARHCPPNEDIDASLALAEALFVAGDYKGARAAIRAALERNKHQAAGYPEPVSDLYRADARVSRHLGLDQQSARSTREILNALQAGLPKEDHRHFGARLEISESLTAFGRYGEAQRELDRLAAIARRAGREDVAAIAELRSLWISYVFNAEGPAQRRLRELAALRAPDKQMLAIGAKVLLSRIYRERGEEAKSDALLAEIARTGPRGRQLLFAPPYQLAVAERVNPPGEYAIKDDSPVLAWGNTLNRLSDNFEKRWIDVGFWVQPDGKVSGLEILRKSGTTEWADPLLRSIRGRLYSTTEDKAPAYRLERYSYTAGYEERGGSHTLVRSPRARVEYLDLTAAAAAEPRSQAD